MSPNDNVLAFEEVEDFELVESGEGSKYRATVLKFLSENLEMARIKCNFIGEAHVMSNGLKRWIREDEAVQILIRGRMVYLVRKHR